MTSRSPVSGQWHALDRLAMAIIAIYFVTALGVWLGWWARDWSAITGAMWEHPSLTHWLGTNLLGQDIAQRAVASIARAFEIGLTTGLIAVLSGGLFGSLAGFFARTWIDAGILWLAGTLDAIPFYLLVIALAFSLRGHPLAMHVAMALAFWTTTARVVRAEVIRLRRASFVEAARVSGLSNRQIIGRHILPHTSGLLIAQGVIVGVAAIKAEVILSFLGIGFADGISWGIMIAESTQEILAGQYMNFAAASLLLFALVASLSVLADRLQSMLDPRDDSHVRF